MIESLSTLSDYSYRVAAGWILSAACWGMPSMSVGQTIGWLSLPAPDVLGGLLTQERHLNFPSDTCKCNRSSLYIIRFIPRERVLAIPFREAAICFGSLLLPGSGSGTVCVNGQALSKVSHPEVNLKTSQHCPNEEQRYLATCLK